MKEMLAMQKNLEETQAKELALAKSMEDNKKKLLTDLAEEEAKREEAVRKLQEMKEREKETLVTSLYSAETRTDALIEELMRGQARNSDPQKVLEELERERKEMEEMFSIKAGEEEKLRGQEILREMQRQMAEEMRREQLRNEYEEGKKSIVSSALSSDLENSKAIGAVLATKGKHQEELISNLLADEKYQREAFSSLFVQQDVRHKEICERVEQIQSELASLTMVEMTKKDLKMEFERDTMAEKREMLTKMLLQLMDQKTERAKELQSRLQEMEEHRNEETENYWLIQYQKLLDAKPKHLTQMEDKVEPLLKEVLMEAGAEEYVPVFALKRVTLKQLSYMKDKELSEMGVHNTYLRQKILMCAERRANAIDASLGGGGAPSAPPATAAQVDYDPPSAPPASKLADSGNRPTAPSAPPPVETFQSTECVICLEQKCDIIFLPCGHVCVCNRCEADVVDCPLCRARVAQKVRLR